MMVKMIFNLENIETTILPGGEYHPKISAAFGSPTYLDGSPAPVGQKWLAYIKCRLIKPQYIIKLITVTDAIKRTNDYREIHLITGYFPGGRQDRFQFGEAFTCKVYADLINAQNYTTVSILDPHSEVTPALLNNCKIIPIAKHLQQLVKDNNYDTIIIPDAGAAKKTFSYYFPDNEFNKNLTFIQCLKKRDITTGKLSGFKVCDEIKEGANCLIVDDICDGGNTFLGLAQEIKSRFKPAKLSLYTTHGIYSKGTEVLKQEFNEIFCTNSIREQTEGAITIAIL